MFMLLSYFEVLAVSSPNSAAGSQVVLEYSFLVGEVHPFMSEPIGPCYGSCEGVCAQEGCRAVGGPWLTG